MNAPAKKSYTAAESIQVLKGLEAVRKRPGMYIGTTDEKGLHHLVWEIVDNSVDEYLNGFGDAITVTLHAPDAISVTDNGRGIPVDIHPEFGKPGVELILTTLHSGAKFGDGDSYIHSGGLHGVGSSVVNALSRRLVATIRRDGGEWRQEFAAGVATGPLQRLGSHRGHGTTIYFEPDPTIFKHGTHFNPELIRTHLEAMSYIHSGLKITFCDEVAGQVYDLSHPGGLPEFLVTLIKQSERVAVADVNFAASRSSPNKLEVALGWTDSGEEVIRSYVNGIRTPDGGTHENGLRSAIAEAVRGYMRVHDLTPKGLEISARDIREGVVAILSVFVREPMFQSQTKNRLNNPEMTAEVENFVRPALETWLNSNKRAADAIVGRIILAARARAAMRDAENAVKRKTLTSRRVNLPGKLADCKSNDLDQTELFIVEGDSAGGSAKQGRDNHTQAVLPLRGKILNSEGFTTAKALANAELQDLVSAIGTGAGEKFNLAGLRYGKIILLMDADDDGYHISTLLLTFFFRHMRPLIEAGRVYIAQPPLFRIDVGKETYWARDREHKAQILRKLRANAKPKITRFKGLGEMDAKVLRETTLDPRNRTLLRVEIDSLPEADRVFSDLMGKDATERTRLITSPAELVAVEQLETEGHI
jgi:DNA gyrase subunit B